MPSKGPCFSTSFHWDSMKMFNSIGSVILSYKEESSRMRSRQSVCGSVGTQSIFGWELAIYEIASPKPDAISRTRVLVNRSGQKVTSTRMVEVFSKRIFLASFISVPRPSHQFVVVRYRYPLPGSFLDWE